jgi:hypothetical protein
VHRATSRGTIVQDGTIIAPPSQKLTETAINEA